MSYSKEMLYYIHSYTEIIDGADMEGTSNYPI